MASVFRRRGTRTAGAIAGALAASALFASTASATVYNVTVTTDDVADNGNCTLREAVQAANTNAARDACPAGTMLPVDAISLTSPDPYELTIPPDGTPNDNLDGDLDLIASLTIDAPVGSQATILQSGGDRLFHPQDGQLTLTRLHLFGGDADAVDGGAVLADGATLVASESVFEQNVAAGGGAIASDQTVSVQDSHFIFNEATADDGGAVKVTAGIDHVIEKSSFELNTADERGGAISLADDTDFDVLASSFLGNEANTGSAIHVGVSLGSAHVDYVTIAGNEALTQGGGALTVESSAATEVTRSILAENTDPDGPSNCDSDLNDTPDNAYNLIDVNDCGLTAPGGGNNLLDVDPQLAAAGVYFGGPTVSRPPFIGSPAVDAIPTAECGGTDLDEDQYSTARPQPAAGACDIGAVEGAVQRPAVTPPQTTPPATGPTGERAAALKKCKKKKTKKARKKCRKRARRLPV